MPSKHKYKCLNLECPGPGNKNYTGLFVVMNAPTPCCPACGCSKVEDWGDSVEREGWCRTQNAAPGTWDNIKHDDRTFRRIADQYSLTDMSNKDGKPIRVPKEVPADAPKINYNGMEVPQVDGKGACINMPGMAQKLQGTWTGAGTPSRMLKGMTNVVAEHKG